MSGGWFPDPSGRFGQRWYDGHAWTDRVVGANGSVVADPVPDRQEPWAPPAPQRAQPAGAPPVGAAHGVPPGPGGQLAPPVSQPSAARPGGQGVPGLLLGIGLVGVVASLLSLVALPWSDGDDERATDITSFIWDNDVSPDDAGLLLWSFFAFGGYLVLVVVVAVVLLAGIPLGGSGGWQRITGAVVAGLAALYQTATVAKVFAGDASPEMGAWVGVAGYFVVLAAMIGGGTVRRADGPISSST